MEMLHLYYLTIFIDYFTLVYIELNREYVFILYSYTIAIIILLNTMKISYLFRAVS